jgi:UDP-N-acetylglucosamine acyltransferase
MRRLAAIARDRMTRIHATAVVAPGARIAEDVEIGPYCCVAPEVEIEAGSVLVANVVIEGRTRIGGGSRIHPFVSLGQPPQYVGFKGKPSGLDLGPNSIVREYVTMNAGTNAEGKPTRVEGNGLFLPGAHVGHDCRIGHDVVMASRATLAGHVTVGSYAVIGSQSAIHQYCRIGKHARVGNSTAVGKDIVPFAIAAGNRARLRGLNVASLRQQNFPLGDIRALRDAYREIFLGQGSYTERLYAVAERFRGVPVVMELIDFITADKNRPICTVTADTDE